MPTIPKPNHARLAAAADRITQRSMDLWWNHVENGTSDCVSHFEKALPGLAFANREFGGKPLLNWLVNQTKDWSVRKSAANALGLMGEKAATKEVLTALLENLQDERWAIRHYAAKALGAIGAKAATKEVLAKLLQCLRDEEGSVRSSVAEALGAMGEKAATADVLVALLEDLRDEKMWYYAAKAFGAMGAKAATPEVLAALLGCLWDENLSVRSSAAEALGAMGEKAATADVLVALLEYLRDENSDVRSSVSTALKEFHKVFLRLFQHGSLDVTSVRNLLKGERGVPKMVPSDSDTSSNEPDERHTHGQLVEARSSIIEIFEIRFGEALDPGLVARLDVICDLARLRGLRKLLLTGATRAEFEAELL